MTGRVSPTGVGILAVPIDGQPVHAAHRHEFGHQHEHDAGGEKAIAELGPVGYTLLRSEFHGTFHYRESRVQNLVERRDVMDAERASLGRGGLGSPADPWQVRSELLTWELMGAVGEYCEGLAALFSALRARKPNDDLGDGLLSYRGDASSVVATAAFKDRDWWRHQLGIADRDADAALGLLPDRLHSAYLWIARDATTDLDAALSEIPAVYEHRFHRVVQRRKHAFPFVSPWFGLAWMPADSDDGRIVTDAVMSDAFIVLDGPMQLVVPADRDAFDRVVLIARRTSWLHYMLAGSVLARAENPASRFICYGMTPEPDWITLDDHLEIGRLITGHSFVEIKPLIARQERRSAVAALAHGSASHQGRNEPCACGSGKKYKRCHGAKQAANH